MGKSILSLKKAIKSAAVVLFALYSAYMLWLLFIRSRVPLNGDYWELVRQNISLIPFRTLFQYIKELFSGRNPAEARHAFINIFGNILLFVPFGVLLPLIWKRLRTVLWLLLCFAAAIVFIEAVQLFTLRGACDIDDLILNTLGAFFGFLLFHASAKLYSLNLNRKNS